MTTNPPRIVALCHDCRHQHLLRQNNAVQDWADWQTKHARHRVDMAPLPFAAPEIPWKDYEHNANVNIAYAASATITISPENVASSSTFVAGVEGAVIDNTSNKYDDALIGGTWTSGTTPTANTQVLVQLASVRDDAPTYPDVFDGTASAETLTSAGVGRGFLKLGAVLDVDTNTSNRPYDCLFALSQLFGGLHPLKHFLFITHNTGVNSNSTAGNHVWKTTGITYTVA